MAAALAGEHLLSMSMLAAAVQRLGCNCCKFLSLDGGGGEGGQEVLIWKKSSWTPT